ncbi:MAG: DEAD/DEAH box helicase [Kofleriaceae bacterium]
MPFSLAHPGLQSALAAKGYRAPTPVQAAILDPEALGRDLLVSAQTGSGKTVAFGLAMASTLLGDAPRFTHGPVRALVIAPTRELALQVQRELLWLYAPTGARVVACVGGMDPRREAYLLREGAHIVVGTPGRLRDHVDRGNVAFGEVAAVVLDEADEMLDLGFREDIEALLDLTPATRRTLLFSATMPAGIASLAKRYQKTAHRIATVDERTPHVDIEYQAMLIAPRERELAVVNVLRFVDAGGALVFCATRDAVTHLAASLNERGFAVVAMSGELSQAERTRALQALRDGRARVCIATDVAARGLDLPDLGLVVHADLPQNAQVLLHRSGRTGRAGRKGQAIVLVPVPARRHAERMFQTAGVRPTWTTPPTAEQIRAGDAARLVTEIATMANEASDEERAAAATLVGERTAAELATVLVRLHRARLPAPEELSRIAPPAAKARGKADPRERPVFQRRGGGDGGGGPPVWFRIDVGRMRNADPRWLIPVICTRGGITKAEIGAIRVLPRETRFEIAGVAAEHFEANARQPPKDHPDRTVRSARIERAPAFDEPGAIDRGPPPRRAPPPRRPPPRGE